MNKLMAAAISIGLALSIPTGAASQQDPALIAQGAQVYSTTCGRCHNARPASERSDREWMPIVTHMRARANLTKSRAAAVLAFLQATNAPEMMAPMAASATTSLEEAVADVAQIVAARREGARPRGTNR